MAVEILQNIPRPRVDRTMVMGVVTMALAVVAALFFVVIVNGGLDGYPYLFLLPWIFGLAVILCIPLAIFHFQRKFSFYNPIVFAIISYFFPAFVVGGISLAAGLSNPYFLSFIQDPKHNLPLTIALTA